jgi:hypothetical protein
MIETEEEEDRFPNSCAFAILLVWAATVSGKSLELPFPFLMLFFIP